MRSGLRFPRSVLLASGLLGSAMVGGAFFLGKRWARHALMATPPVTALCISIALSPGDFRLVVSSLVPVFIAVLIHRDVRNQLFFRQPVTPGQLKALWNVRRNNPLARRALSFGLSAVFMPVFAPLAVLCGAVALRRVDPEAHPPIGRGGQALAGIILGISSLLLWGFFLLPFLNQFLSGLVFHD